MRHPDAVARVVVHEPPLYALLSGDPEWEPVRRLVDEVAFGHRSFDELFDDAGRATILANAGTWLDQSRDPERLAVDLSGLAGSPIPVTVTTGTDSLPAFPEIARRVVAAPPRRGPRDHRGGRTRRPAEPPRRLRRRRAEPTRRLTSSR